MNFLLLIRLNLNILVRKHLLNFCLAVFSPTNSFTVALSQNLDKYILRYQKELFNTYQDKHNPSDTIKEIAA